MFPYTKMKGKLEDAIIALKFKRTVILRPALLVGERQESRLAEGITQVLFKGIRGVGIPMGAMMVDADEYARRYECDDD